MLELMCITHFVADFLLQSREMGKKKSYEIKWLLKHLAIQTVAFVIVLSYPLGIDLAIKVALLNSLIHGIIDWNIWRLYKYSAHKRIMKQVKKEEFDLDDNVTDTMIMDTSSYAVKVKSWKFWEDSLFFDTIGLDQLLHMLTLIMLWRIFIV